MTGSHFDPPNEREARKMPTGAQYSTALQNTRLCFERADLKDAKPVLNSIGVPKPISGSSATVFSLIGADGLQRTAVKCFTREVRGQERRYEKISEHLARVDGNSLSQPWKIDFEYIPEGILVEGSRYPILRMRWVDGIQLSHWLDAHYEDQEAVAEVARNFAEIVKDLYRNNMAHGDLQHGNLLVAPDRTMRLVDYDGLFVPSLAGQRGTEIGHRNYQSPCRTLDDFGPNVDNFSSWVIYTALSAVAADPALWPQMHDPDGDYLLLAEDDFSDPTGSARFPGLLRHSNPIVRTFMERLACLCGERFDEVPRLDLKSLPVEMAPGLHGLVDSPSNPDGNVQPGRPAWLETHLARDSGQQDFFVEGFQAWGRKEFFLCLLGAFTIITPVVTRGTGFLDLGAVIPGMAVLLLLFAALSVLVRARRPEVEAIRNSQRSLNQLISLAKDASAGYVPFREELDQLVDEKETKIEEYAEKNHELTVQLHRDFALIESERKLSVSQVDENLRMVRAEKEGSVAEVLRPLQQPWVTERLPSYLLREARISGITAKHVGALAQLNLHSAADIVGVQRAKSGAGALLVTSDGRTVKVRGIGPTKANALHAWRQRCEEEARTSCPVVLSVEQNAQIERVFKQRLDDIQGQKDSVEQAMEQKRNTARRDLRAARTRLADRHQEELDILQAQIAKLNLRLADIRVNAAEMHRLNEASTRLLVDARKVSYFSYLQFLCIRR
ncbi:AarF/UbiB family protein [Streptomyces sp. NBC_01016]|uniref:AarF/UbiB family protein n=1 Tax=Streptomyces sp. NBC_01016 TaxID=2903720 RepID=UPI0022589965|nr:AarF/UbiB family protein [Streptomyces sp. NBC_01016]MCX4829671.1 AarF/UbiB family protein [Streptomyces sp. NBC_01016]